MDDRGTTTRVEATDAEAAVADAFVAFIKARALYPPQSVRVSDALERVFARVDELRCGGEGIPLVFFEGSLRVRNGHVPLERARYDWLKDRFDRTALAGIELLATLTPGSLLSFAARLEQLFSSKETEPIFEKLWGQSPPGLRLIERRFMGRLARQTGGKKGRARKDYDPLDELSALIELSSDQAEVVDSLCEHGDAILERLEKIHELFGGGEETSKGTKQKANLLGHVIHLLPAEAMHDHALAAGIVEEVLDAVEASLLGLGGGLTETRTEGEIRKLMASTCHRFFGALITEDAGRIRAEEDNAAVRARGHPGDELVTDDLDALIAEVSELPRACEEELDVVAGDSPSELLGICLHKLVHCVEVEDQRRLHPRIARLLRDPGEEELGVLQQYLAVGWLADRGDEKRADPVLDMLRSTGRLELLVQSETLSVETVAFSYPKAFSTFLDALDPDDPDQMERIAEVAREVGAQRILDSEFALRDGGGIHEPMRALKILSSQARDVLPFVKLISRKVDLEVKLEIIRYLRALKPPSAIAAALWAVDPPDDLPPKYLEQICAALIARESPPRLIETTAMLVRKFIVSASNDDSHETRRVYAILALKSFADAETEALCKEISGGSGFLGFKKESKAVRDAAKSVLTVINERRKAEKKNG